MKRVSQGAGKEKYSLAARSVLLRTAARDANGGVGSPQAAGTLLSGAGKLLPMSGVINHLQSPTCVGASAELAGEESRAESEKERRGVEVLLLLLDASLSGVMGDFVFRHVRSTSLGHVPI